MSRIKADDLFEAVFGELEDYASEVTEDMKDAVKETAKKTLREVKNRSPVGHGTPDPGAYKKGWTETTVYESPTAVRINVHNRKHYRLTHLLEDGHALVGGGRTRAQPHIAPAEKFAERELQRAVEVKVKK